ncbi:pilin [Phytohabitans kaempferiae]|uniref:Pilin n=1 Tax=Phytohabitans kaempferiae TaxID=1620943 RepID=A0ABV6MBM1_9ACTN
MFRIPARPRALTYPRRRLRTGAHLLAHVATVVLILSVPAAAFAAPGDDANTAALRAVINNLRFWVMGILAAIATLYLVLAGVYRATAGGDPAQVDKSKEAFKNALIGYALAVLSPVVLGILQSLLPR